jgi:hypothetical protein
MKKLLLYIAFVCLMQSAFAQGFTLNPKVSKGQGPASNFQIDAKSIFTNNSNDSVFEWVVLEVTATSGWAFGMCDPGNCLTDLVVGSKSEFTLGKGKSGEFKGDFVPDGKSGSGKGKVLVYSKANPTTIFDTLEFQMSAWPTSVKEVQATREFNFYPNPAKDRLTIRYNAKENTSIDIYNVLGSKVKTVVLNGFETDINIGDLQNGIYFIRFKDANNQTVSKPFTKSE